MISPLSKRIIGVTGQQLAAMKVVLGIAYGEGKLDAVRSALTGGLVTSLVTHSALARRLVESASGSHPADPTSADAARV